MLPTKGYFSSINCPFYASGVNCVRKYCHFKHPKKVLTPDETKVIQSESIGIAVSSKPHIPISSVPTKPAKVSISPKRNDSLQPKIKDASKNKVSSLAKESSDNDSNQSEVPFAGVFDYDPVPIKEGEEKTYSRYSYEKGHDSGDEIMENYKKIIPKLSKADATNYESDTSKSLTEDNYNKLNKSPSPVFSSSSLSPVSVKDVELTKEKIDSSSSKNDSKYSKEKSDKDNLKEKKSQSSNSGKSQSSRDSSKSKERPHSSHRSSKKHSHSSNHSSSRKRSKSHEHSSSKKRTHSPDPGSSKKHSSESGSSKKHSEQSSSNKHSEQSSSNKHSSEKSSSKKSDGKCHRKDKKSHHKDKSSEKKSSAEISEKSNKSSTEKKSCEKVKRKHSSADHTKESKHHSSHSEKSHHSNKRVKTDGPGLKEKETILISDSDSSEKLFGDDSSSPERSREHSLSPELIEDSNSDHNSETPTHFPSNSTNCEDDSSFKPAKVRIAHVPNVSSFLSAKEQIKQFTTSVSMKNSFKHQPLSRIKAISSSLAPEKKTVESERPMIRNILESPIPLAARQSGLNNIYDEFVKFIDPTEASEKAVSLETEICEKVTNAKTYRNCVAVNVLRIRKAKGDINDKKEKPKLSSASTTSYTYGMTLYECFSKYLLTPEELQIHGFPQAHETKRGCAYISKESYYKTKVFKNLQLDEFRTCANCGKEYRVGEDKMPMTQNDCRYHWGRFYQRAGKFSCCQSDVDSEPCTIGRYHVADLLNEECMEGFVTMPPYPEGADINKAGIFAIDCEMCYTSNGREIVRVSMISIDETDVYDALIKPAHPVLDYCTRFSGITEEKLRNVTTSLRDVQKQLMKRLNQKTILVGHSLENDLKALKIIHSTVVDTSVIFPHKRGLPQKRALRNLASEYLQTVIQTGEEGHDSLEDSVSSLHLVLYQVVEDAKVRKPRQVKSL